MNSDQLPTLLELTNLPPNSAQEVWQAAVTAYLASLTTANTLTFWHNRDLTGLTTETAREIVAAASYGNLDSPQCHVVLAAETTNPSAQNALLKTLEEPPLGFHLLLAVRHSTKILPTIVSRCQLVRWHHTYQTSQPTTTTPSLTIKALNPAVSYGELVTSIQTYKDRSTAIALLETELLTLHQGSEPPSAQVLKATLDCWQALQQNSNIALTLEKWLFAIHSFHHTR
jgi:hypothetical protein